MILRAAVTSDESLSILSDTPSTYERNLCAIRQLQLRHDFRTAKCRTEAADPRYGLQLLYLAVSRQSNYPRAEVEQPILQIESRLAR